MASGGGPKPRRPRSAGMRAWRSMPLSTRKAIKGGKSWSRAKKAAFGSTVRKARIRRGDNPNSGMAPHQHIRAKAGGTSSKAQVRKVTRKVVKRAAASGKYGAPRSQKSAKRQARRIIRARRK